jgi:hypothetical protein
MEDLNKSQLTWESALKYHSSFLTKVVPALSALYILEASEIEAIGKAINSINDCNLSAVRHDGMTRLLDGNGDNITASAGSIKLFKSYGREFAKYYDTGRRTKSAHNEILVTKSPEAANAAEGVAYLEMWENLVGNSIMAFLNGTMAGIKGPEQNMALEILTLVQFFPMYVVLALYYTMMSLLPPVCSTSVFYKVNYVIITMIQFLFVFAVGAISLIVDLYKTCTSSSPAPSRTRGGYIEIESSVEQDNIITVELVKPVQDMKVGLRFGAGSSKVLMISNTKPNGMADNAGLRIGDEVKTINGQNAEGMSPKEGANLILTAIGVVRFEVKRSDNLFEYDEETV